MSAKLTLGAAALVAGVLVVTTSTASSQNANGPIGPINLQSTTPGTPQIGHGTITGTFTAGYLKGNGLGVTGINANNIAVGKLADDRLSPNVARVNAQNDFVGSQSIAGFLRLIGGSYPGLAIGTSKSNVDFRVHLTLDDSGAGYGVFRGPNGNHNFLVATPANYPNNGWAGVRDSNGVTQASMYVASDGKGVLTADVKNFVVANPANPAEDIVYASVEGPEAAAYVRGTGRLANGKAHIVLPDHFASVVIDEGMTVQLTPKSGQSRGLAYINDTVRGFDVIELSGGQGNYEFSWEATAVRRMHEDYRPVRRWDASLPSGTDVKSAWKQRLASVTQQEAEYAARRSLRP